MNRMSALQTPTPADDRASSVSEIRIEQSSDVTDEELRRLSLYFEKGRDEIQKKVDYLLSQDIRVGSASSTSSYGDKNGNGLVDQSNDQRRNFIPVTLEIATKLREFTVGSCVHSLSNEWKRGKFSFITSDPSEDLNYGLLTDKKGPRGLIMSVQAVMLKNLIASSYKDANGKDIPYSEIRNERKILKPNETEKREVLVKTLAEILWKAGENTSGCLAVDSFRNCFDPKNSGAKKSNYFADGLTERLHFYHFDSLKLLEDFLRKNLSSFQKENGCIMFIYSLIMSRSFERLQADMQGSTLIGDMEECKFPLFNLVLTGTATPYIHNNTMFYTPQGESRDKALIGIKHRSDVGMLYWNPKETFGQRTEVGSMLKTPKFPVWLAIMGRNTIVVLFNTNINLINDWRLEQNFTLHLFTGLKSQDTDLKLDIISRNPLEIRDQRGGKFAFSGESEQEPEIISVIKSKWPDSELTNFDGKDLMSIL